MLQGYRVFDADAHGMMTPRMWADLPANYVARRPRPVRISDDSGLGAYNKVASLCAYGDELPTSRGTLRDYL